MQVNMDKIYKILVINPGSTSTKVAYYENEMQIDEKNLDVDREEIKSFKSIFDQYPMRRKAIEQYVADLGMTLGDIDIIASRGAGGGNQKAGAYMIDEAYVGHCYAFHIPHASSLGAVIALDIMKEYNIPGFIYDADGTNEFNEYAVLSGMKEFPILPGSHTLNAKAAARKGAALLGGRYEDYNLIVCHMGGGVSTGCHDHGRLVDSTCDAFAPERSGAIPMMAAIPFTQGCFSGKYTLSQMIKMQFGEGGLVSYLGTSDLREVERRIAAGDAEAEFYYDGMIYGLAKDIAAMATVVNCKTDGIVLTGGMAYSKMLVRRLSPKVRLLAPVLVVPGSQEMEGLATGALRVIRGEEPYHRFGPDRPDEYFGR
jgi:butyrate kinase